MTIIQNLIDARISVIVEQSNEAEGKFAFTKLTEEQKTLLPDLLKPPTQVELSRRGRLANSVIVARAIPNYATWTQTEWQTYFDANLSDTEVDKVTTIALARMALKRQNLVILNLVKLLLALRDNAMPDLPER